MRILKRIGLALAALVALLAVIDIAARVFPGGTDVQVSSFPSVVELGGEPDDIVVLIHGTFAPGAEWTQPGSRMVSTLKAELADRRVQFVRIDWSGFFGGSYNNTHRHRFAAGERVAALIKTLRADHPKARLLMVAHSHGGNVALYAAGIDGRIDGLVTMGTPFIEVASRDVTTDFAFEGGIRVLVWLAWLAVVVASVAVGICGFIGGIDLIGRRGIGFKVLGVLVVLPSLALISWPVESDGTELVWVVASSTTYPGAVGGTRGSGHYETRTKYKLSKAAVSLEAAIERGALAQMTELSLAAGLGLADRLTARIPAGLPVLCVRTAEFDEALVALDRYLPMAGLPGLLLASPTAAVMKFFLIVGCAVLLGLWQGVRWFAALFADMREDGSSLFASLAAGLFSGLMIGYIYLTLAVMGAVALLAVLAPLSLVLRAPAAIPDLLAYGSGDVLGSYFTTVRARPEPGVQVSGGRCETRTFTFDASVDMQHSEYYRNAVSIAAMATWLKGRTPKQ